MYDCCALGLSIKYTVRALGKATFVSVFRSELELEVQSPNLYSSISTSSLNQISPATAKVKLEGLMALLCTAITSSRVMSDIVSETPLPVKGLPYGCSSP